MSRVHTSKSIVSLAVIASALLAPSAFAESPRLTFGDAERIALQRFPGSRIEQIERDWEQGREVFEIDLHTQDGVEQELRLDASNGEILRIDRDR